ncbi:GtrA family protein [Herbaspirillum sp. RTI4]|uniref:GtrA family protein n=1 Tax=Herbaspirillum sp. RTI4 TaxID=3048640 RepID=UPI002AB57D7B|nr:GtrA family protein [Herbaspirillum sp. RTI4]MDY7577617.1 GtrA family protein [Herbaspirillum sp. RTI4]
MPIKIDLKNLVEKYFSVESIKQIFRYGVVGLVNISTEFLIFNIAYYYFKNATLISNTWAVALTTITGFLFHHAFTFRNQFYSLRQIVTFGGVVVLGGALNYLILIVLVSVIPKVYIAKLVQILILSLYNFGMYKRFVYINKD